MLQQIFSLSFMTAFLAAAVRLAVPLMYGGIGETIAEKSGILNIGMEGVMLSGAFFSFAGAWYSGNLFVGLLAGMLGGLGFIFVRAGNIGHQNHMDVAAVFHALLNANLADGLQERLALNITGGTADFGDDNIGFGAFGKIVDIALDFVGNVGNDLHRLAQISALAFLVQHVPIDLARRQVRVLVQVFINKALIMTQIQVGFGSVISHEHLAVL